MATHGGRGERALWGPFYKGDNPICEGSILMTNHLPQPPPLNAIMLGIRFQHTKFGETQTLSL